MIGRLNHIAIAVPDLTAAGIFYKEILGASISNPVDLPDHGVTTVFVTLPNTTIELLAPLGLDSPISHFLQKNPTGGLHHICFEVPDVDSAAESISSNGIRVLSPPQTGAHGVPVIFLHPKDCCGCLIELEERIEKS